MPLSFTKLFWSSRCNRSARRPRHAGVALHLEPLEERWLLNGTVITVTTAADDPTTPIAGQTTLRDAINQANQTTGATIVFAPRVGGHTIQPLAALPAITGAGTTIDGTSVVGLFLDGSNAFSPSPDVHLAGLDVEANNVTIEGLAIGHWSGYGITIGNGINAVSNTKLVYNTVFKNGSGGIDVRASGTNISSNNHIIDNSGNGVEVDAGSQNTILDNLIYGNSNLQIFLGGTANNSISAPVLISGSYGSIDEQPDGEGLPTVIIEGELTLPPGAPDGVYTVQFFAGTLNGHAQGPWDDSQIPLGTITVMAKGGANTPFTYTYHMPIDRFITATVTDPNGNTSQFSNDLVADLPLPPTPADPPSTSPTPPPPSIFQAALTLYMDGAQLLLDQLARFGNPNLAAVNASIALNSPNAGSFAELFVLAGEAAMAQQLSAANHGGV